MDDHTQLTRKALQGVAWSYLTVVGTVVLQLGSTAVLARALGPTAFGLVAMANLALRFGQYFAQMGVSQAIVQRKDLSPEHVRAGFWLSLFSSVVVALLFVLAAPLLAQVFREPSLTPVLRTLSIGFVLSGIGAVGAAMIRRTMRFRALAAVELGSYFVGYGLVGIAGALSGWGVWSLVAASLAQNAASTVSMLALSRNSMRPVWGGSYYRDLLSFGSRVSLTTFLEFGCANLDTFVVGRVMGSASVGLYSRALNTASLPLQYIGNGMSKVLLPAFAKVQHEPRRLVPSAHVAATVFAGLGLPIASGVAAASGEIVRILLGEQWLAAIPVMRISSVAAAFAMVNHLFGVLLESQGAITTKLRARALQFVWFALLLLGLGRFGLLGYAAAFAVSEASLNALLFAGVSRVLGVRYRELALDYAPGLIGLLVVGAMVGAVSYGGYRLGLLLALTFALEVLAGAIGLAIVALKFRRGQLWTAVSGVMSNSGVRGPIGRMVEIGDRWCSR